MFLSYAAKASFVNRKFFGAASGGAPASKRKAPPQRGALGVEEGNFHESEIQTSTEPLCKTGNPDASPNPLKMLKAQRFPLRIPVAVARQPYNFV